jgi:hypothetical protein
MCEKCFYKEYENFPSPESFGEFQSVLDKLDRKKFVHIGNGNFKFHYDVFECKNCNEIWWISGPDNAWRGYCLKKDNAIAYIQMLQKKEQDARIGLVLLVLFILIAFILYIS